MSCYNKSMYLIIWLMPAGTHNQAWLIRQATPLSRWMPNKSSLSSNWEAKSNLKGWLKVGTGDNQPP